MNGPEPEQDGLSFLQVLRQCLVAGTIVVDGKNQITTFSSEAETITALPVAKALGRSIDVLPTALQKLIHDASASGQPASNAELALKSQAGNEVLVRAQATPLQNGKSKDGVVVVLNNITPAKRLEENMHRLSRLASIGTLSAGTAHEIKNALVAVKTFTDLLLEKHSDTDLVKIVQREMGRIDSLVSQVLRYAGPARSVLTSVRLHEVLDHSLQTVKSQLKRGQISLDRKFKAPLDSVKGDDYQLQQAFVNLFLNAIEAMDPGGKLAVATDCAPSGKATCPHVRVTIADTGKGISPENLKHLFEPFFTTKKSGTGLGLPITQRIIQDHAGAINVESQAGRGSTFHVLIPALAAVN